MKKSNLIKIIADKTGITKQRIYASLGTTQEGIVATVYADDKIQITYLDTFESNIKAVQFGRKPATSEIVEIPEIKIPVFTPNKNFKELVKC